MNIRAKHWERTLLLATRNLNALPQQNLIQAGINKTVPNEET
jgi:hypothetical protein